jgi:hypothetical protein
MIARGADLIVNCLTHSLPSVFRFFSAHLLPGVWLAASMACAVGAEPPQAAPLRIAVYDVAPYGYANPDVRFQASAWTFGAGSPKGWSGNSS